VRRRVHVPPTACCALSVRATAIATVLVRHKTHAHGDRFPARPHDAFRPRRRRIVRPAAEAAAAVRPPGGRVARTRPAGGAADEPPKT